MKRFLLVARLAAASAVALTACLISTPAAGAHGGGDRILIKENRSRVTAIGDGFVLKLNKDGIRTVIDEDSFGDPSSGNPIQRSTIDLTGSTLPPFECENGTYTIRSGFFSRTFRVSQFATRPPPYPEGFAAAFPGILTPFVGELEGTVTDASGETLRFVISDLVHEELTADRFTSIAPIHGLFVDQQGRVRDRISLIGRVRSGPNGENAVFGIEDRGSCRQTVNLPWPGSEGAVGTGPLFILPFSAPVTVPDD